MSTMNQAKHVRLNSWLLLIAKSVLALCLRPRRSTRAMAGGQTETLRWACPGSSCNKNSTSALIGLILFSSHLQRKTDVTGSLTTQLSILLSPFPLWLILFSLTTGKANTTDIIHASGNSQSRYLTHPPHFQYTFLIHHKKKKYHLE